MPTSSTLPPLGRPLPSHVHVTPSLETPAPRVAPLKVLVVGASGGSGRATIEALLDAGHQVTAYARHGAALQGWGPRVQVVEGDVLVPEQVDRAVQGHDAVIITLGIRESALRVRLFGAARTAMNVRSLGTRHVVAAMLRHGVRRLVVQTSFGVGETRDRLPRLYRLMFQLLLKPQVADTERQEREVRDSGLDWVIAQPVNLVDVRDEGLPCASARGEVQGMQVSRRQVGRFLAHAVGSSDYLGRSVALSA
ncbi:NAD(P)-dependent oxidoreductase [Caldimonas brevitalea]|uniref:Epimerase n=1 Tax=Caldimonas brevitalea TaxID=413882 RepID=A0A0G3BDP1_9BURK|nr:NAD(P)-binding oxidoreductase [Caldimonas brevitalea]AKJ27402.1 epimerase [Caldimonas brevitalea]